MKKFRIAVLFVWDFSCGTIPTHRERITCRSSSLCHYHKKLVFVS